MPSETRDAQFWDRTARKYAASPVSDTAAYERTLERTRHFLRATDTVLEFGCGTGTTALKLAPDVAHIVATDISQEMIAIARKRAEAENAANATFEVAEPGSDRWADGSFEAVLGFNVLHLISDRAPVLRNIHRILKPGGYFISKTVCLGDLNPVSVAGLRAAIFLMRIIGKAPSVTFVSSGEIEREIEAAGFTIVEHAYHASKRKGIRPFLVAQKEERS